ncbi:hypothetical protein V8E53_013030 [Lactarius tabidus]
MYQLMYQPLIFPASLSSLPSTQYIQTVTLPLFEYGEYGPALNGSYGLAWKCPFRVMEGKLRYGISVAGTADGRQHGGPTGRAPLRATPPGRRAFSLVPLLLEEMSYTIPSLFTSYHCSGGCDSDIHRPKTVLQRSHSLSRRPSKINQPWALAPPSPAPLIDHHDQNKRTDKRPSQNKQSSAAAPQGRVVCMPEGRDKSRDSHAECVIEIVGSETRIQQD